MKMWATKEFFGIREHAMAVIVNGLSLPKLRAFGATYRRLGDHLERLDKTDGTGGNHLFYLAGSAIFGTKDYAAAIAAIRANAIAASQS